MIPSSNNISNYPDSTPYIPNSILTTTNETTLTTTPLLYTPPQSSVDSLTGAPPTLPILTRFSRSSLQQSHYQLPPILPSPHSNRSLSSPNLLNPITPLTSPEKHSSLFTNHHRSLSSSSSSSGYQRRLSFSSPISYPIQSLFSHSDNSATIELSATNFLQHNQIQNQNHQFTNTNNYIARRFSLPSMSSLTEHNTLASPQQQAKRSPKNLQSPKRIPYQTVFKYQKSHKKSKSATMINKFSTKPKARNSTGSSSSRSKSIANIFSQNAINFIIHKLPSDTSYIPIDQLNLLNDKIYPSIVMKKYSTSAIDPQRPYLTVYEYPINDNNWIIWDYETGYVHLTGVWKASLCASAASHSKADIVKLLESTPKEYQQYIKRIRGGFLKIQGTWLPYKLCRILAIRCCYFVRYELIPLFGSQFPDECLKPGDKGFGELRLDSIYQFDLGSPMPLPPISNPPEHLEVPQLKKSTISSSSATDIHNPLLPLPLPQVPIEPVTPKQTSTSTLSSVFSHDSASTTNTYSPNLSYTDMLEIVNASKCLQSISQGRKRNAEISEEEVANSSTDEEATTNYTLTPEKKNLVGISNILLAAGMNLDSNINNNELIRRQVEAPSLRTTTRIVENNEEEKDKRRGSMKINDLLS
ncbi:uncharacterized protein J8A68_002563 [[Candida] subhashii]|uniref:HTH APSES-type domain-containing protein n=1 Tax=[Candida] subhashii TaxID=561895 RepID=A0A8J5QG72_9ASCO|nr:uncharacterized protein J8A68_002563 [[Candida] subhashii]KAG7663936.1 hypothetical protein J8A68_002563 [[Candida] subhashii]